MSDMGLYGGSEAVQAARLSLELLEEFIGTPLKATGKWLFLDGNALRGTKWIAGMMQKGYFLAAQDGAVSIKWILKNQGLDNQIIKIPQTANYDSFRKDLLKLGVKFAETSPKTLKGERVIFFNNKYASMVTQLLKMDIYKNIRVDNVSSLAEEMPDKNNVTVGIQERQKELRMKKKILSNPDMECITINETLLHEENAERIKTRIPGQIGEYVWLEQKDLVKINNGKTIFAGLEKERVYAVVNKDNKTIRTITGKELYANYDPVDRTGIMRAIGPFEQEERAVSLTEEQKNAAKSFLNGPQNREIVYIPHSICSIKELDKEVLLAVKRNERTPVFYMLDKGDIKANNKDGLILSLKDNITQYGQGKRTSVKREELQKIVRQEIPQKDKKVSKTKVQEKKR